MIDNSASMYDMAYDSTGNCYDNAYSTVASYPGYFDEAAVYSYNSTAQRFEAGATMPGSCTFKSADFCVTMAGVKPNRTVSVFVAKGKFLNWLATSKLDLQKKILTGGKYNTGSGTLLPESRGCMGRRFIRLVPNALKVTGSAEDLTGMTFAVRGPTSLEPDYTNPATQGGSTRIEIYDAAYNLTSCTAAVTDWTNVTEEQLGQVQGSSTDCLACSGSSCSASAILKSETYIHMVHQCYWYFNNHKFANTTTMIKDCENIYDSLYPGDIAAPSKITNELGGESVCSSVIAHPYYTDLNVTGYVANDVGFLGRCVTLEEVTPGNFKYIWNATCLDIEMADFCEGMRSSDVTDPSGTGTVTTGTSTSVPSFIMDAGVNALGTMSGSFFANVKKTTAPSGLIQEFKDYIRFGAMVFNQDGTASECDVDGTNIACAKHCSTTTTTACFVNADCPTGESCVLNTKLDGGKVASYIAYDPVGDHAGGVIKAIDDIQATAWTPFAEAYYNGIGYFANRTDIRLQTQDFDVAKNPSVDRCRLNNILIISDGGSTADQNSTVSSLAATYNDGDTNIDTLATACSGYAGSKNLDDLAWLAYNRNIKDFTKTPTENNQMITTYVVYNGQAAANTTDECLPANLMNETAQNGGTTSAYIASSYDALFTQIREAFTKIAASASSGTAASIVNKRNESGANLLTAIFYPLRDLGGTNNRVRWAGDLQNYWYYYDSYFAFSGLREDTVTDNYLRLDQDYYCNLGFDTSLNKTVASRYAYNPSSGTLTYIDTIDSDNLKALWKAGNRLHLRSAADRTVYSNLTSPNFATNTYTASFTSFVPTAKVNFKPFLRATTDTESETIIKYTLGYADVDGGTLATNRSRTVTVGGTSGVWKLGDIISSTPKVQSAIPINSYNLLYGDGSYSTFLNTNNYKKRGTVYVGANDGMFHAFKLGKITTFSKEYEKAYIENVGDLSLGDEQWAFVPRNALPYLKYLADPNYEHLYYVDNTPLLVDASIHKHAECTATNYWECTRQTKLLSSVTDTVTDNYDAANSSWRTIVIGGMGLGGASHSKSYGCQSSTVVGGVTYPDCTQSPIAAGTFTNSEHVGRSSYFAMDVTNPTSPTLLWEFTPLQTMGYALNEPVIVRTSARVDGMLNPSKNGRWFAVFSSGPTGPVNTATHQFYGKSDRPLRIFVVDVATGKLVKTFDLHDSTDTQNLVPAGSVLRTANAFGSSLSTNAIDSDENRRTDPGWYSTDVVYVGYTRPKTVSGTTSWANGSDGGLLRLVTNDDPDPANWKLSQVIDGVGPVNSTIDKLYDDYDPNSYTAVLWLYFGTGRYFYRDNDIDSADEQQKLVGIKDPCYYRPSNSTKADFDINCTTSLSLSDLEDTSLILDTYATDKSGWYINLNNSTTDYKAERVITTPAARTSGLVIYTTYSPSTDLCGFGGKTSLRLVNYRTGGFPAGNALRGKVTIQLSTGAIVSKDLASITTIPSPGSPMPSYDLGFGKPPAPRPQDEKPHKPVKKILHILEK